METYLKRFTEMVSELERHPKVVVLNFASFPPVSETGFEKIESILGFPIDGPIRSFYKQTNGLQFRWITIENEDFDSAKHKPYEGILDWSFGKETYHPEDGLVMIQPIELVFLKDWKDIIYFDWMQDKQEAFGQERINLYEFSKNIRPFDLFSHDQDMAFSLKSRKPIQVLWGDDHHACYTKSRITDFESYLEFLLAQKGLVSSRKSFYRKPDGHNLALLQTPRPHWSPSNSFNLLGYLLNKVFPQAGESGSDMSNLNPSLIRRLAQSADPLTVKAFENIHKAHQGFLLSGGGGGHWEILSVSGMVLGFYKGGKNTKGKQANLERQNLPSGISLGGVNLPYANFCGCFAPGVSFVGASLMCCLFSDCTLEGAIFRGAQLGGSDFSRANLRNADFRDADVRKCDFENCDLRGADFSRAMMSGARFPGARLEEIRY